MSIKNSKPSSIHRLDPGNTFTTSREAVTTYEVIAKLVPNSRGPNVMADQYSKTRCAKGRWRCTRQIWPRVRSMVTIRKTADINTTTKPAVPRRLALRENWLR